MFVLGIQCATFGYSLSFINQKAAERVVSLIRAAEKDDPTALFEVEDDYNQMVAVRPAEVKGYVRIDRDREAEVMIKNKLRELKTQNEFDARIKSTPHLTIAHGQHPFVGGAGSA